jgi:YD repeat-containing protein
VISGQTVGVDGAQFDPAGNLIKSIDGNGNYTQSVMSPDGLELFRTTYNLISGQQVGTTAYEYNAARQLVKEIDGAGNYTEYTRDADGRVLTRRTTTWRAASSSAPRPTSSTAMGG